MMPSCSNESPIYSATVIVEPLSLSSSCGRSLWVSSLSINMGISPYFTTKATSIFSASSVAVRGRCCVVEGDNEASPSVCGFDSSVFVLSFGFDFNLLISFTIRPSCTSNSVEHSRMYIWRTILSGITLMLFTTSLMREAFLSGSLADSWSNRFVLKRIKSTWWRSMYAWKASAGCLRAKLSGSSPSGNKRTLMCMPSFRSMSIPLSDALIPALSPSYSTVILSVKRCNSLIWPSVRDVPEEATTFSMPLWCIEITSV